MSTVLPILVPALIGLWIVAAYYYGLPVLKLLTAAPSPGGPSSVVEGGGPLPDAYRSLATVVTALAQLALIRYFGYATTSALVLMVLLLSSVAIAAEAYLSGRKLGLRAVSVYFLTYLVYWAVEKYILTPTFLPVLEGLAPRVAGFSADMKLLAMVGVSYVGFKLLHFVVDLRRGDIASVNPLEFISWLMFFPSILAGPMMRFQDWEAQRRMIAVTPEMLMEGLQRMILGLFMKLVVADTVHAGTIAGASEGMLAQSSFLEIAFACCLYYVYLFFDFAGYSHIAIGAGLFWGIRLPENFNKPFIARNLSDFWNRWHISLSTILRDYLFYPMSLTMKRSAFFRSRQNLATILPPLITFLIAGVWHGAGLNFVIFGGVHGIGLAALALMKRAKTKNAFAAWWASSPVGYLGSIAITFLYVSFGMLFFALRWPSLMVLWHRL